MSGVVRILGHRGVVRAGAARRENTLAAYRAALAEGGDGVELDVRRGRDGSLLLHHDPVTDQGRAVAATTLDDRPPWMPTLGEALDVLVGSLVNIEIKNLPYEECFDPEFAVVDSVVALLAERGGRDDVIISSFHPGTVDRVKTVDARLPTGVLSWFSPTAVESIDLATAAGHDAIHPHVGSVDPSLVDAAHAAGLAVNVWTVNDADTMTRLAAIGVDAVVTDDVALAVSVLRGG